MFALQKERSFQPQYQANTASQQIDYLTQQVKSLSQQLHKLELDRGTSQSGTNRYNRSSQPRRCWMCGQIGHIQRNCPQSRYRNSSNTATPVTHAGTCFSVITTGCVECRPTKMLVDTGSAVTIVNENILKKSTGTYPELISSSSCPIIVANGEELTVRGKFNVKLEIGGINEHFPVDLYVSPAITTECLLGADFLDHFGCIIDLGKKTITLGGENIPLQVNPGKSQSSCYHLSFAETVSIPPKHQKIVTVQAELTKTCESDVTYDIE